MIIDVSKHILKVCDIIRLSNFFPEMSPKPQLITLKVKIYLKASLTKGNKPRSETKPQIFLCYIEINLIMFNIFLDPYLPSKGYNGNFY